MLKIDLVKDLKFPSKKRYHCSQCRKNHNYSSKIGKSHLQYRMNITPKNQYIYLGYFKNLKSPTSIYKKPKSELYYCGMCKRRHRTTSKIGKLHNSSSYVIKRLANKQKYWCGHCNRYHRFSSNIGKKHKYKQFPNTQKYYCTKCSKKHYYRSSIGKLHLPYNYIQTEYPTWKETWNKKGKQFDKQRKKRKKIKLHSKEQALANLGK